MRRRKKRFKASWFARSGSPEWCWLLGAPQCGDDILEALLGVGEEHHGLVLVVEEGVIHAGEAGAQATLDEDDPLRVLDLQDGHAAYGAVLLLVFGRRVDDVVGADDYDGVGLFELGVYVL